MEFTWRGIDNFFKQNFTLTNFSAVILTTDSKHQSSVSGDARSKIFTHILYDSYVAPTGFRYETDYTADNINV